MCIDGPHWTARWNSQPNARPEPLPEAEATEERTLEAVGSRPLFGCELCVDCSHDGSHAPHRETLSTGAHGLRLAMEPQGHPSTAREDALRIGC
jgi:hypothetical protein